MLCCLYRWWAVGDDDARVVADEGFCQFRESSGVALGQPEIEADALSINIAKCGQRVAQRRCRRLVVRRRVDAQDTHERRSRCVLRRCRNRGAQREEEADGLHSMTSSARARINGEIVRPSALAVLRLTTSSKVVGC